MLRSGQEVVLPVYVGLIVPKTPGPLERAHLLTDIHGPNAFTQPGDKRKEDNEMTASQINKAINWQHPLLLPSSWTMLMRQAC